MRTNRLAAPLLFLALLAAVSAGAAEKGAWSRLDGVAREAVAAGNVPGVVLLVGHRGKVVYRKAFGNRQVRPEPVPMTPDTVFDLASLTKVVATTSAVMALVEEGKLRLRDPVARYWPEFGQNGKERVTVRHLLTHTSGLAAWENYQTRFADPGGPAIQDHREKVLQTVAALPLRQPPDTRFVYSDLGFITLGELVRRVSGEPLERYVEARIFRPLGMRETGFNPGESLRPRVAPTTEHAGAFRRGEVHDPNAAVMAGVAGHAGLFGTADDLARFARMLLCSDSGDGRAARETRETTRKGVRRASNRDALRYPLSPATVREMTTPNTPAGLPVRGLGWDIDTGYSHVRGDLLPVGSFGHTGFTGTYLWVDPYSDTFIIGLSNRVHPDGGGNPLPMWAKAANVVAGIVRPPRKLSGPPRPVVTARAPVLSGIDVLQRDGFRALQGRKVGLITNRTGVNRERVSTIDLLHKAPGVQLLALFSPEHGLRAELDEYVPSSRDEKTGLPIHSLYGQGKYKPAPEQLQGLDTLVYDIQDVGVRYYTYISTLGLAMEAAGENGLRFVVLDRPNPITGTRVDGPMLEPGRRNFAAYYRLPVRHGMTVGELARYYRDELGVRCDLAVVAMEGWRRSMWFDETGLPWVDPSPNIRNTRQAELYAGIGFTETANISVGRGTDTPFERFGAPWIDGHRLAAELNRRSLPGLTFIPVTFKPVSREFRGEQCGGVDVRVLDREAFDGMRTGIEILDALVALYPAQAKIDRTPVLLGTDRITQAILARRPVEEILLSYADEAREFRRLREKYLLYR